MQTIIDWQDRYNAYEYLSKGIGSAADQAGWWEILGYTTDMAKPDLSNVNLSLMQEWQRIQNSINDLS